MLLSLVLLLTGCAGGADMSPLPGARQYVFTNGRWFDGRGFQATTWYSVQGRLTRQSI